MESRCDFLMLSTITIHPHGRSSPSKYPQRVFSCLLSPLVSQEAASAARSARTFRQFRHVQRCDQVYKSVLKTTHPYASERGCLLNAAIHKRRRKSSTNIACKKHKPERKHSGNSYPLIHKRDPRFEVSQRQTSSRVCPLIYRIRISTASLLVNTRPFTNVSGNRDREGSLVRTSAVSYREGGVAESGCEEEEKE